MTRLGVPVIFAAFLAACGGNSSEPKRPGAHGPEVAAGEFSLSFEKNKLGNGLTVVLHQDRSDPIVAMATVVHVGSNRERPGRTGFAHFFEHMSFNNSENVPMGANRKMIPELGGTRNGGTWSDGTIYYEVVPKDAFEKLMWIDSDRFGYMIKTVNEGTLEREKQVVKNEKRQNYDNRPYGHTSHVIQKALYPAGHPYSWPVIGELEDLQGATLDDVRSFYFSYYTPQNATLVVAGDIDLPETKALVERWFGEIKPGKAPADPEPMPVKLPETKRLFHLDSFATVAELRMTFPTVEHYHADSYALEALGAILSDGKNAPLYKQIVVETEQSSSVAAYQSSEEIAGTFTIAVRANPGVDLDDVARSIDAAMKRFETEGFRDQDLERFKARNETAFYAGIETILDRALALGTFEEFAGDPSFMFEDRSRYRKISRADVERVYRRYIQGRPAVVTSFVPKTQPRLIVDGSIAAQVTEEKIEAGVEKAFTEVDKDKLEKTPTKHDRSEPPLGELPPARTPAIWKSTTARGIRVLGIEQREIPMVSFQLRIDSGQMMDDPSLLGTANLAAQLLNEGTRSKTPLELEDAIGRLGATIRVSAGRTSIDVSGQTLAKNYDATMALVTEMLLEPRWDKAEFKRLKIARLAEIEQFLGDAPAIASNAFYRQIYGLGHVAGQPFGGSAETVARIEIDHLRSWYQANVSPKHAVFHVTGAVGRAQVDSSLVDLDRRWAGPAVTLPTMPRPPARKRPQVFFIDMPGAKQSVIYVGRPSVTGGDPRYYRLTVVNNRLGEGSSARLTQKLRIEKGYSYGAFSTFTRAPYHGVFMATSQVRSNVTLESLQIFRDLIATYAGTFTATELETTRNLMQKADTRRFESLAQLRDVLEVMSHFNLPDDYIARQSAELAALTLDQAHELIRSDMAPQEMIFVVVGDGASQLRQVEKLGYGKAVRLDRLGAPLR